MTFRRASIAVALLTFFIYAALIASLTTFLSLDTVQSLFSSPRTLHAIKTSVFAATLVVFIAGLIALPAGFALSRHDFAGKRIIDTMLELPLFVSPAALGAMILIFFSTSTGIWIQENLQQFVFTIYGIILAQLVAVLGVAVRLCKAAFDEVPPRYDEIARSLGASSFTAFRTVVLPNARRGLFAAAILTWAKAMGEFGATITVAGTIAMRTETLPVSIYMRLASADIEGAVGAIALLIGVSLLVLYFSRFITSR
ncbi:MAG TPA: ABC transporter permease [Candidatus Riflebacteria bacterium]|jgi:molybdate transport system permease protein|nr:ABC transporter permease [Candidatus Riflebacteria bacterium]